LAIPFNTSYAASKFAMIGFSDGSAQVDVGSGAVVVEQGDKAGSGVGGWVGGVGGADGQE
jgi:hypothetical protein